MLSFIGPLQEKLILKKQLLKPTVVFTPGIAHAILGAIPQSIHFVDEHMWLQELGGVSIALMRSHFMH